MVPLTTIDSLLEMHFRNGWVNYTGGCNTYHRLSIHTQLFIMCALEHLGNRKPHRQFTADTNMSRTEHLNFFNRFLENMNSVKPEYIFYPRNMDELQGTVCDYADQHLPGAGGSIDVVHVKWSRCPAVKVKNRYHRLPLNAILTIVDKFLAYLQSSLVPEATSM
jgi:hypothetical protein